MIAGVVAARYSRAGRSAPARRICFGG